ncbi:Polysaccharide biosynthesis family protein [Hyella patelloides LEGE 07179]|uniref:Polysaccharide biosynthesis family protein n=1 Tax=Hyella patelloides LEGE 07179 TaxID=945734 RepID=A0A563VSH7_9CYAN|nr:flippase [Hyella patelloides]VEP14363.1 Polysaccharide biosynthesis family protein [Hyella patelloides LEGE 07179]
MNSNIVEVIKVKIAQITKKGLFKDASWMLIARLINVVVQAAYFVIVARALGAANYGSFVGVTSLASLLFPFIALGSDNVLVKEVSVNRQVFSSHWGNTLLILVINSICLTSILLLISPLIFPDNIPLPTIACLLVADLFCLGLLEASNKAFRAVDSIKKTAQMVVLNTVGKLLAALCLVTLFKNISSTGNASINIWAILYLISSILVSFLSLITVNKIAGKPRLNLSRIKSDIGQGIYFSIGMSASNINNNVDKTMLASMATLEATGIYGSAYRFINIGNVPIAALFNATYPRFFKQGVKGIKNCFGFAKKLLPLLIGYGILSFVAYQVFAPLIPKILGAEYENAISTLRWLAILPAINALHLVAADTLTGSGYQKIRSIIQVTAAILNVSLNIWLIPTRGLYGAIWATLASDGVRLVCLWIVLFYFYIVETKNRGEQDDL